MTSSRGVPIWTLITSGRVTAWWASRPQAVPPMVLRAPLRLAKERGALTVSLTCNAACPLENVADIAIHPDTGAEVVTGSTRMKAGSAHKMILNMISTSVMIQMGYVYENLMVHLKPSNRKLKNRMIGIVCDLTGRFLFRRGNVADENGWNIREADRHTQDGRLRGSL